MRLRISSTTNCTGYLSMESSTKKSRVSEVTRSGKWRFSKKRRSNYLSALQVNNSIYEYVEYQSDVERRFAQALDKREDIKLFVKLPGWFKIETPVGTYNPDWAIVKHDDGMLYLVRETKATKDFLK